MCYVAAAWPMEKAPRPTADVYCVSLSVLDGQLKRSVGPRKIKRVTGARTHVGQRFWVGRAKKVTGADISVHVDSTWTSDVDKTTQAIQDTQTIRLARGMPRGHASVACRAVTSLPEYIRINTTSAII